MLENGTLMRTEENVAVMCAMLHSLLVDQQDQPPNASETEDFEDEQHLVARFVHLIQADTPDEQFLLLNNARKILGAGGKARIKYTLTPIIFELYKLILRFVDLKDEENWEAKMRKDVHVCDGNNWCVDHYCGNVRSPAEVIFGGGAMVADKVPLPDASSVVYEFISKADQVRTLCTVVSLYWKGQTADSDGMMRNGDKVVEVMKKAAKIATQCLEPIVQQQLFVQIINTLLYYYEDNCLEVTESMLVELISRTKENAVQLDVSAEADALEKHLAMTLQHIKDRRKSVRD
ncbi:hypothetical protein OSTOST_15099 [Ostertagia ostertagi]